MSNETSTTTLILIPTGDTCWDLEGRLTGSADLSICPEAYDQVQRWAEQLKSIEIDMIFSASGDPEEETAKKLADALNIQHYTDKHLAKVNMGLWQGMLLGEIKTRHPKAYRQWQEHPENVTPPEGERLTQVQDRLENAVGKIIKKYPGKKIGLVLGRFALALARISREGKSINEVWQVIKEPLTWHEYSIKTFTAHQE